MTDATPAATENVGRGATFTLLAIPVAIVAFALLASFTSIISGLVAIGVALFAGWAYQKGAGAPLSRKGWGPFVAISGAAILLGTFSGIVAATWANYKGHDGMLSSTFFRSVGAQFTTNLGDTMFAILIGIGLGAVGIASVMRGPRVKPGEATVAPAAQTVAAPIPPVTPPATPSVPLPPAANEPSPGVILNGKPIDPKQK